MKLAAIYNTWGDLDLLEKSIYHTMGLVEGVIIVASRYSNYGEGPEEIPVTNRSPGAPERVFIYEYSPDLSLGAQTNERNKRNYGLQKAKELGFTHFLMMDADEFYESEPFFKEMYRIRDNDIAGMVCRTKVYFAKPTLTIGFDTTLVPFIHKITPDLRFEWNPRYPYAFEGPKREIRIDPTRQLNINSGVEMSSIVMHHYSWVRKDYTKKIRNSSARVNIEKSTVLNDLMQSKPGYYCEFYGKHLEATSNPFNLCV